MSDSERLPSSALCFECIDYYDPEEVVVIDGHQICDGCAIDDEDEDDDEEEQE